MSITEIATEYRVATNEERLANMYDGLIAGAVTTPAGRLEIPIVPTDFPATMDEARDRHAAQGFHFFDADGLRWHGTRFLGGFLPGGYFVTSEYDGFERTGRGYTVRRAMPGGGIDSPDEAGGFLGHATAKAAHRAAHKASTAYVASLA